MDRLRVTGLALSASIGTHDWEARVRQRLLIDLEWDTDAARAARADDLADADDYGRVAACVGAVAAAQHFNLIESLAQAIAAAVFAQTTIRRITVTVHKPSAIPAASDTSVTIERSRQESSEARRVR